MLSYEGHLTKIEFEDEHYGMISLKNFQKNVWVTAIDVQIVNYCKKFTVLQPILLFTILPFSDW